MITCVVDYQIDPAKIAAFEAFANAWIHLVNQHGGRHHGYFLPWEEASDRAPALFCFESLAGYEQYRMLFGVDPEFVPADRIRDESGCVVRYERSFMWPLLPEKDVGGVVGGSWGGRRRTSQPDVQRCSVATGIEERMGTGEGTHPHLRDHHISGLASSFSRM